MTALTSRGGSARREVGETTAAVRMAVVGAGYWGPNIVRNAIAFPGTELSWICDFRVERAREIAGARSETQVTADIDEVLADESVEAVAIATPPRPTRSWRCGASRPAGTC